MKIALPAAFLLGAAAGVAGFVAYAYRSLGKIAPLGTR